MTRDDAVEVLLDNFGAPMGTRLREAQDMAIAALRAPAVTGEAAQHAETLRVMADDHATPDTDVRRQRRAACLAGAAALAAPPAAGAPRKLSADETEHLLLMGVSQDGTLALGEGAADRVLDHAKRLVSAAGAPPALVALVREWQEARKPATLSAPGEFLAETFQSAVRRMSAADEALAAYRLDVGRACFLCDGTGNEGDEKIGDVDCHGCGGAGRVLPSLREELTEIIRWRFKTADGAPMNGPLVLKRAQEIANEIAPHIEEAVGER